MVNMKKRYRLVLITMLLIACSCSPSAKSSPITLPSALVPQPIFTQIPASKDTPPQKPTATLTATSTPTATIIPTSTVTPTATTTPTEDLSFYALAACLPQNTSYQRGTVTNVVDGDTIEVLLPDGTGATVRYIGMDAPENDFPYFAEARQANLDLVSQKEVVLIKDRSELDQYGRWLRYVIAGNVFVNLEMVETGFAKAENYPPDTACSETFASAEMTARKAFTGLWAATQTPEPSAAQVVILAVDKRAEWVDIKNAGSFDVDLAGWNLVSERGHQECPLSGVIKAGDTLRIWAMTPQGDGYSCGYNTNIWNNSESDPAVLYNAAGNEVSRK